MPKSKLVRNLKPGDRITLLDHTSPKYSEYRKATVTVLRVQERRASAFTGRRMWEVCAEYPWWWPCSVTGYSDTRIELA